MRLSGYPYRWRVVALLFFLSALNYLDRQTLSGRSSRCASGADIIMVVAFAVVSAFRPNTVDDGVDEPALVFRDFGQQQGAKHFPLPQADGLVLIAPEGLGKVSGLAMGD